MDQLKFMDHKFYEFGKFKTLLVIKLMISNYFVSEFSNNSFFLSYLVLRGSKTDKE